MSATHDLDGIPAAPSQAPQDPVVLPDEPAPVAETVDESSAQVRAGALRSAKLLGQSVSFQHPMPSPPDYMADDQEQIAAYTEGWQSAQAT